jgi:hypothetical protein
MRTGIAVLLAVSALVAAGCGGDDKPKTTATVATPTVTTPKPSPAALAFRRHAQAAVEALRTGVEQPFREGKFKGDFGEVLGALATAGSAVVTATKELTEAVKVATSDGGIPELAQQAESLLSRLPDLLKAAQDGSFDAEDLASFLDDLDRLGASVDAATPDLSSTTTTP